MSKVSHRALLLQPLLFATALPLNLLAGGTTSVYAQTTYTGVSSANQLSADITKVDLASQAPTGGVGTPYSITLAAGATLTESADIAAINLKGTDTLTINGQGINGQGGAVLNGAGAFRGFFAYSGNLTIEKSWGWATGGKHVTKKLARKYPRVASATTGRLALRRPRVGAAVT